MDFRFLGAWLLLAASIVASGCAHCQHGSDVGGSCLDGCLFAKCTRALCDDPADMNCPCGGDCLQCATPCGCSAEVCEEPCPSCPLEAAICQRPEPGPPPVRYRPEMPPKFLPVPTCPTVSPVRPDAPEPWRGDVEVHYDKRLTFPGRD